MISFLRREDPVPSASPGGAEFGVECVLDRPYC
jgi:hypothetical protein